MDRMVEQLDKDISEVDNEEATRPDKNPNKIIKNFKKWENFLYEKQDKEKDLIFDAQFKERSKIQDGNLYLLY